MKKPVHKYSFADRSRRVDAARYMLARKNPALAECFRKLCDQHPDCGVLLDEKEVRFVLSEIILTFSLNELDLKGKLDFKHEEDNENTKKTLT